MHTQLRRKTKVGVNLCTHKEAYKHYGIVNKEKENGTQSNTHICTHRADVNAKTHILKPGKLRYVTECTVLSIFSRDVRSHMGHLSHCGHPAGSNVPLL